MENNAKIRQGWELFCVDLKPDLMITLITNQKWSVSQTTWSVSRFFGRLDRKFLGHTFNRLPPAKRADGIVFVEKAGVKAHAHALVTLPYWQEEAVAIAAAKLWGKLCPSGSIDFRPICTADGAANYCTKEMMNHNFVHEQIFLLREKMSQSSLYAETK